MKYNIVLLWVGLLFLLIAGCKTDPRSIQTVNADSLNIDRYSIIQVELLNERGGRVPKVIKLDKVNGDSWVLTNQRDTLKWIFVDKNHKIKSIRTLSSGLVVTEYED